MNTNREDFALLYRQALAERHPDRKTKLLSRVSEIISEWHRQSERQRLESHNALPDSLEKRPAVSVLLNMQPPSFKRLA